MTTSELSGFYRLDVAERRRQLAEIAGLSEAQLDVLAGELGLCDRQADRMVENAVGILGMPLGICVNLRVNGADVLVPMAVEEPSVVAASSFAAKLLRAGGGVTTQVADPHMIGQIQLLEVPDADAAEQQILSQKADLLAEANAAHKNLVKAGGGAIDIEVHRLAPQESADPLGPMLVVHIVVDVRDAMGANAINSMCERLAPRLASLSGGRAGLRILSNLTDRRTVRAVGRVPHAALARGDLSGETVAERIQEASVFAERDPYRAATHNKGLMNGVDAVLVAFGQDWRAVEAGAHAYAAREGRYTALARWRSIEDALVGEVTLPLAVGTVGGVAKVHPTVQISCKIAGIENAGHLAGIVTAVGLAQNLAALRALAVEGIQSGHMRLHARNIASEAGATGQEISVVANRIADDKTVNIDAARAALAQIRKDRTKTGSGDEKTDLRQRFDALRALHLQNIETLIDEIATENNEQDSSLVEMGRYHMRTGGKRLRALLPLVVAEALGEDPKRLLALGAACEVLHNATLVHDDLQDGDVMRRGQPTVWSKYGAAQAVNLGDAMFYYAVLLAQQLDAPAARREAAARRILTETLRVIGGQEAEFALRASPVADLEQYFSMVEGKTSGLFALPMVGAAEVLGADPTVIDDLFETARHLGILFQIQDDVLDLYGDKGRDQRGSDIREGKRSVLVVHALTNASHPDREWLLSVLDAPREETTPSDVEDVLDLFDRTGSLDFALGEIERRAQAAVAPESIAQNPDLRAMAKGLAELFTKPIAPLLETSNQTRARTADAHDLEFCERLLPEVSRTFALSIAALPPGLRTAVGVAYLLCRVVDTVEDEVDLDRDPRERLFDLFDETLLADAHPTDAFESLATTSELGQTPAEQELVRHAGAIFRVFRSLPRQQREAVRPHVHEMSRGMREYAQRAHEAGQLRLADIEDLERYCYFVAGTVGLLLTSLFEHTVEGLSDETRSAVRERAVSFGLGLQLVNIVKDVAVDFARGDVFLPLSLADKHGLSLEDILEPESRQAALSVVRAITERARKHLDRAAEYTLLWPAEEALAVRRFCSVPLALAVASLAEVEHSADTLQPGRVPKVTRKTVETIFDTVMANAHDDDALRRLLEKSAQRPEHIASTAKTIYVPRRPPVPPSRSVNEEESSEEGPHPMQATKNEQRHFDGKVLVTGAAGHLGANLVRRLLAEGRTVRVLLRHGSNNEAMDGLEVERAFGDLRDYASVTRATEGMQTVYHVAANVSTVEGNPTVKREIYDSNVVGTRHLLRAARENDVVRTVVTGSFSATGYHLDDPSRPASEEVPIYPFDKKLPYARTKEIVEHECLKAVAEGQDVVVATSCAIIGPHDYKPSRMGRTLLDYAHGRLRAYIPGGFEFVAADDIVEGHLLAMHRGRSGQKYVFSTQYLTLDDIMDLFEEATGRPRPRIKLPAGVMARIADVSSFVLSNLFPSAPQRFTPGAVRILRQRRRADLSKAKNELGYTPTSIRKAIHDAYADFAMRGLVPAGPTTHAGPAGGTSSAAASGNPNKDTAAA